MKITFLGAAEEVTGSRYLIEHEGKRILVDCGMFQGPEELAKHNKDPFPVEPKSIDALVLTHAHIDHTGYIPLLIKNGFAGPVYCSDATYALCAIMLIDSGNLQEEDAKHANEEGGSHRTRVEPLYTIADAQMALYSFKAVAYDTEFSVGSLKVTLIRSGHILGSSFVIISDGKETLTFSGDLGRPQDLIMKAPPHLTQTDYLVIESTYGDRLHDAGDPIKMLGEIIHETIKKKGKLIIPSFAVGRTQTILYCLYQLKKNKAIPDVPIYLDSPMGIRVTNLLCTFTEEHTLSPSVCEDVVAAATFTPAVEESKKIDQLNHPAVIIAGSGMANGGRVLYHLRRFISDAKNTVLFVGFQAKATLGQELISGSKNITIYGKSYPVHAAIKTIDSLSAHADYNEVLEWLSYFKNTPKKVFITHGELQAAESLKEKMEKRFGWNVVIPKYSESFDLD
jgi:metallo-beta-lactamase family protein